MVLGALLRVALLIPPPLATPDSVNRYEPAGRQLATGGGLPGALRPDGTRGRLDQPLYPLFLAGIYRVAGEGRRAVVAVQLLVELSLLYLLFRLARLTELSARARAGVMVIALVCPVLPFLAHAIWTETLATALLTATCLAAVHALRDGGRWPVALGGLGAAACLLTRPDLAPAVLFVALAAALVGWWRWRRAVVLPLLAAGLCAALPLGLWMARNHRQVGEARPLGADSRHLASSYERWLGTWMDDLDDMPPYYWYAGLPGSPSRYPAEKVIDAGERARADAVLARGQAAIRDRAQAAEWDELTRLARQRRPLRTLVVVPVRRLVKLWVNVPSYVKRQPLRGLLQGGWILFLSVALAGLALALRRREIVAPFLLAVIAGRSVLPLFIGIACEPRYVAEALPACFLATGFALARWLPQAAASPSTGSRTLSPLEGPAA